jgi:hypothetical protein
MIDRDQGCDFIGRYLNYGTDRCFIGMQMRDIPQNDTFNLFYGRGDLCSHTSSSEIVETLQTLKGPQNLLRLVTVYSNFF